MLVKFALIYMQLLLKINFTSLTSLADIHVYTNGPYIPAPNVFASTPGM